MIGARRPDHPNLRREQDAARRQGLELPMSRRGGIVGLAASILIACVCAGLVAWRLTPPRPHAPAPPAPVAPSPVAAPEPAGQAFDDHRSAGRPGACATGRGSDAERRSRLRPGEIGAAGAANAGKGVLRQFDPRLVHRRLHGEISGSRARGRGARRTIGDELGANRGRPKQAGPPVPTMTAAPKRRPTLKANF